MATQLHPILAAVSLVIQIAAGNPVGNASGFFFKIGEDRYFVTNKHVVTTAGAPGKPNPDTLRLRLHLDQNDISKNDWLDIPLFTKQGSPNWKTHPKDASVDVAVIPLSDIDLSRFFVAWLQPSDYLPQELPLHPGEDVFVVGYPESFHDLANNLPVFRNASIASAHGVPFNKQPLFLVDSRLHPGMSGSPVLTKPKNTWLDSKGSVRITTGVQYYLLGVLSGNILWAGSDSLGLGAVWYASLLSDIVK